MKNLVIGLAALVATFTVCYLVGLLLTLILYPILGIPGGF